MWEDDIWADFDEECLIYYRYWLSDEVNVNRLKWLYDDE
jgi:hypothetical protein